MGILALFTTRYLMPFRLDDVLLMLWAKTHSVFDAFDPIKGQLINSFRPVFALVAYGLTRFAGWDHPFWWHLTLDLSLIVGIAFTGLTARYLARRWFALEISVALYFLAFLPILNIFFWYSDLTYGLELAFTCSAWYFGLRGLYEARLGFWLGATLLASIAVLSKEPAFILVHVVLLGSFLLERHRIIAAWIPLPKLRRNLAIAGYVILLCVTVWVALVSPTRANRFFSLNSPDLTHFVRDRIEYYSAIYLSIIARVLLFSPIVYAFLRRVVQGRMKMHGAIQFPFVTFLSIALAVVCFQNILIAVPLGTFIFLTLATLESPERERVRCLLPFVACLVIAIGALLVTIQLVKTQLTEAALLTAVLSSWAWCVWIENLLAAINPYRSRPAFRRTVIIFAPLLAIVFIAGIWPKVAREERLLREVRDVRQNANDAVRWASANLPQGSLFAVAEYSLYGIEGPGALTPKNDETKLEEQYTFAGGFVYDALAVLGRRDFRRTYLADSVLLPRVLNAMREESPTMRELNAYVLLQSKLDLDLFHGSNNHAALLTGRDTLVAHFSRGPYPCEIWMLRK